MKLVVLKRVLIILFLSVIYFSVTAEKLTDQDVLEKRCTEQIEKKPLDINAISNFCEAIAEQYEEDKDYNSASWYYLLAGRFKHNIQSISPKVTENFAFSNIAFSHTLQSGNELKIKKSFDKYLQTSPVELSDESLRNDFKLLHGIFPEHKKELEIALALWTELNKSLSPIKALLKEAKQLANKKEYSQEIIILSQLLDVESSILNKNNPSLRRTKLALSIAYKQNKQYLKSLELSKKLVSEFQSIPQEQAGYAQLLHVIAVNNQQLKRFEQARSYFNKAVIAAEGAFKKNSLDMTLFYRDFASFSELVNDQTNAVVYYEKLLNVYKHEGFSKKLSIIPLQDKLAKIYSTIKNYPKAVELLKTSLVIKEKQLGLEHLELADSIDRLGFEFNKIDEHTKALELFKRSLKIRQNKLDDDSTSLALSYKNIAESNSYLNKPKLAIINYKKAQQIIQKALGLNHDETVNVSNKLAFELNKSGSQKEALDLYLTNIGASEKALGLNDNKLADLYSDIGNIQTSFNHYPDALIFYQKALSIQERNLGRAHNVTATSYNNLGFVQQKLGNYGRAREYYSKALRVYDKILGPEHPNTATSFDKIASLYLQLSDYPQALTYYSKALNIRKKVLGDSNLDTAMSYISLGDFYYVTRDYSKALKNFKQGLLIRGKLLGHNNPQIAELNNKLGLVYASLGDDNEAIKYYNTSLKVNIHAIGEESIEVASNYNNLGLAYRSLKDNAKALELLKKSLKIRIKNDGEEHSKVANITHAIADLYMADKSYSKALEYHKKALDIRMKVKGLDHSETISSYYAIAGVYRIDEEFKKSLSFYKKALTAQQKVLTADQIEISDTFKNIAEIYRKLENTEEYYKNIKESFDVFVRNKNQIFSVLTAEQQADYDKHNSPKFFFLLDATARLLQGKTKSSDKKTALRETASDWINYKGADFGGENMLVTLLKNTSSKQVKSKIGQLESTRKSLLKLYQADPKQKDRKAWSNNIAKFKRRLEILNDAIAKTEPEYKQELDLSKVSAKDISSKLDDETLYIDYFKITDNYFILSIDKNEKVNLAKISSENSEEINESVQLIRDKVKTITKKKLKKLPKKTKKALAKLYKILLSEPIGKGLKKNKNFILSLDDDLESFPFEALYLKKDKQFLMKEKTIRYVSNAKALIKLSQEKKEIEEEKRESETSQ